MLPLEYLLVALCVKTFTYLDNIFMDSFYITAIRATAVSVFIQQRVSFQHINLPAMSRRSQLTYFCSSDVGPRVRTELLPYGVIYTLIWNGLWNGLWPYVHIHTYIHIIFAIFVYLNSIFFSSSILIFFLPNWWVLSSLHFCFCFFPPENPWELKGRKKSSSIQQQEPSLCRCCCYGR